MNGWIGVPMAEYLNIEDRGSEVLEEVVGPDQHGNKSYVFMVEKNCHVTWNVNRSGIVTSWSSVGSACKHYTN
jgi:hypothetical protein